MRLTFNLSQWCSSVYFIVYCASFSSTLKHLNVVKSCIYKVFENLSPNTHNDDIYYILCVHKRRKCVIYVLE